MGLIRYRGLYEGEIVFVFGSGGSLNFLSPRFFDGQVCVATNFAGSVFGLSRYYVFSHYHADSVAEAVLPECVAVFTPEREHGTDAEFQGFMPKIVTFPTTTGRPGAAFDPAGKDWPKTDDSLVVGSSGVHGAMHLAAYMGAKFIVLVGVDCGSLGGVDRVEGYVQGDSPWGLYEQHLRLMKARLKEVYGCEIYSLSPFCNPNLEGVQYRGTVDIN